jgi:hypothetical protein
MTPTLGSLGAASIRCAGVALKAKANGTCYADPNTLTTTSQSHGIHLTTEKKKLSAACSTLPQEHFAAR